MATRKTASKKSGKRKGKKNILQVDDPIIVKPGNSLLLEWYQPTGGGGFDKRHNPGGKKKGRKHDTAGPLKRVVLIAGDGMTIKGHLDATDPADQFVICYKGSSCPL